MSTIANELCAFYCLSYKNEERKTALANRFSQLNINVVFYDGVSFDDPRINGILEDADRKKTWSYTYGHFDMINKFLNETDKEHGIFCEDDINLHKEFANDIPALIEDFKEMNLDLLLLGYLTHFKIEAYFYDFELKQDFSYKNRVRKYHKYPDDLWGGQMYMLSRKQAAFLIEKYYNGYAAQTLNPDAQMTPFCSDWTITKEGNRALVYPMYAVEDGKTNYEDGGQHNFHQDCFKCNYDPEQFI
jgi:hypothetical protein